MATCNMKYQTSIPKCVTGVRIPLLFLLKTKLMAIFIFTSINIQQGTSTDAVKSPSIFGTYNHSASATNFSSSKKSRIPCFITNVGINNQNANPLYWKARISSLSLDRFSEVSCVHDGKQPIPGIPELILNGITYSTIDFQASSKHQSPVGFAIDKFIIELEQKVSIERPSKNHLNSNLIGKERKKKEMEEAERRRQSEKAAVLLLTTYWKIYGAMDIALRVLNNQDSVKLLSLSKGPGFVLNFQRARLEGKLREIEFYLTQIIRNCDNCTGIETQRLLVLARASGVSNQALSQAEVLANLPDENIEGHIKLTSGSGHSKNFVNGQWHARPYIFFLFILLFSSAFVTLIA
ncbi:hypothetical protein Pst134EA_007665 [Puccinia striiformis f. sp. tritici]|uniref:hypothetical protein n=1 Tax=Puccinia striiformis f. sp. tritici TaxID=168172 RepID=UPI0020084AD7|nr:hypothetical protein Pst134EA_007665 [Puccinia striiformis f. sp. tritici]KAH9470407.1 hypothetical protein Pst134EA_007665 [Puccinia striiformis f. sp. tritici]